MSTVSIQNDLSPPQEALQKYSDNFTSMLTLVSELGDIIRMHTFVWKLRLLKSGAAYANSHLHAVQAEVILLASGNENLLLSGEADRLFKTLKNCKVRYFRNWGDRLLMEDGFNLLTIIKVDGMYCRGRQLDFVTDYLPPTSSEFKRTIDEDFKLLRQLLSPVMLSTMKNGNIVRGLARVPDKGPILFVGYHELLAMEGDGYQLFWPDQPEFVRMAAQFGVTVIPFGCVGEDDFFEIVLDYNDLKNIPYVRDQIKSFNEGGTRVRDTVKGEDGNQVLHLPAVLPKVPGRLYFLFGKPIEMKGMENVLTDRKNANKVYLQIKSEVENLLSYLKRKREEGPYRSIMQRTLYQATGTTWGASAQVPTFEP